MGKVSVDYDKEQVQIEVLYRTKEKRGEKAIILTKRFLDFRAINSNDWKEIFQGIAQFSLIEIIGKDANNNWRVNIKNQYATASDIIISPFDGNTPPADKISYKLTIKNSSKVSGQLNDITAKIQLSGRRTVNKKEYGIIFRGHGSDFWTRVTKEDYISLPSDIMPKKPRHVFIGWSTNKDATEPNLFLEGRTREMFDKPSDVYAIFAKDAPSIFLNTHNNKKVNLKLEKDIALSKQKLLEFIEANKPQPEDKWSFEQDNLFLVSEQGEKSKIEFDENDNVTHKFELGNEYELKIEWNHKPFILFIDSESNEVLTTLYLDSSQNEEGESVWSTPKFSFDLAKLEKQGKYKKQLLFEDGSIYKEGLQLEVDQLNWEGKVIINFEKVRQIQIATNLLEDKKKSTLPTIYLTAESKIKEEYLPKLDYSWFKGENKRLSNEDNNPAFDTRSKQERDKGVVFDGWYADEKLTDKIYFKNGISTRKFKEGDKLYPKFKPHLWDQIRDARKIVDLVFSLASSSAEIAMAAVDSNDKWASYTHKTIELLKWISYLAMGGRVSWNEFWDGYTKINDLIHQIYNDAAGENGLLKSLYGLKEENKLVFGFFLGTVKELFETLTGIYLTSAVGSNKGEVFKEKITDKIWNIDKIFNGKGEESRKERIFNLRHIIVNIIAKYYFNSNDMKDKKVNLFLRIKKLVIKLVNKSSII